MEFKFAIRMKCSDRKKEKKNQAKIKQIEMTRKVTASIVQNLHWRKAAA